MEVHILAQGKNEPRVVSDINEPVYNYSHIPIMTFCVVEGGMKSGEPSVVILSDVGEGTIILQTSLDKFLMGASGMIALAEKKWGWKRPEGHATLMPPDRATRKKLLEAMKKELEEWDDAEGDDNEVSG